MPTLVPPADKAVQQLSAQYDAIRLQATARKVSGKQKPDFDIQLLVQCGSALVHCGAIASRGDLVVFRHEDPEDEEGDTVYVVQHYTQVNVTFRVVRLKKNEKPKPAIGFTQTTTGD